MTFVKKIFEKAYFIVKMTGPAGNRDSPVILLRILLEMLS